MEDSGQCKFLYLKEISFAVKGELPKAICEIEHDIDTACNKSCPDFQQVRTPKADKANNIIWGSRLKVHFNKIIDLLYLRIPARVNRKHPH